MTVDDVTLSRKVKVVTPVTFGADNLGNGFGYRLGYSRAPIPNGT